MGKVLFHDLISIREQQSRSIDRNEFFDRIMTSMESQKDKVASDKIMGLQVNAKVSHSARLTGHFHYYGPLQLRSGIDSFTSPYQKPVLAQHDEQKDPLGRVVSASYISTNPAALSPAFIDTIENIKRYGQKRALKSIDKLRPYLYDSSWEGFGYIHSMANITDPDGIQKAIDQRYHTISIGYGSDNVWCSECGQDWMTEGECEHQKGVDYGKGQMFLLFGDLWYDEWSFVNRPADDLAQVEDVRRTSVSTSYTDSFKNDKKLLSLYTAVTDSMKTNDVTRIPIVNTSMYSYDKKSELHLPFKLDNQQPGDSRMKLQDIKSMGNDRYDKINSLIENEDARLSTEQIEALKDGDFVGAKRLFPASSKDLVDAAVKFLTEVEDSEEKTELLGFLNERSEQFSKDSDSLDNKDSKDTGDEKAVVEKKDYIQYSFELKADGWGVPDDKSPEAKHEKAILDLLLSLYASKKKDALPVINTILSQLGEDKDAILGELFADKTDEYEGRLDNFKNEIQVLKDSESALSLSVDSLTKDLKDSLAERIVSFKSTEDPESTREELTDGLKKQSIEQLKATVSNFTLLFGDSKSIEIENAQDNSLSNRDELAKIEKDSQPRIYTEDEISEYTKDITDTYQKMHKKDQNLADGYYSRQLLKIKEMKDALNKSEKNQTNILTTGDS